MRASPAPLGPVRRDVALAGAAALAVLALDRAPQQLVAARACAGLPEIIGVAAAALAHAHSPFPLLHVLDLALLAAATFTLARVGRQAAQSGVVGAAVAVAAAAQSALAPQLATLAAAGWLAAAGIARAFQLARGPARERWVWLLLAASAAIWPPLSVALAIVWLLASDQSPRPRALGALALLVVAAATLALAPPFDAPRVTSCLAPPISTFNRQVLMARVLAAPLEAGPYVMALAALGAFVRRRPLTARRGAVWLTMIAMSWLSTGPYPWLVWPLAIWVAAAAGLGEIARGARTLPARVGVAVLILLVVGLSWAPVVTETTSPPALGHDRLSLDGMTRTLSSLPVNATLVSEDASTDLLIRAAHGWHHTPRVRMVSRAALEAGGTASLPLYALPWAQSRLQRLGYRAWPTGAPALVELRPEGQCRTATAAWRRIDLFAATTAFSLVARTPEEQGPVVVYATFGARPALTPLDWPAPALRGFYTTVYDAASSGDRAQLREDSVADVLPDAGAMARAPFVARLELWRTPTAPPVLTVEMTLPPQAAWARVIAKPEPRRLTLCDAFPTPVRSFGP